jgi:L-ascorbate metabolism protein UlaG (beta-lactamase superfamily)
VRLRWLGHATVLLELAGLRVLTDPLLRKWLWHLTRRAPAIGPKELGPVDVVLISHVHHDHLDKWTLKRLEGSPQVIAPAGAGRVIRGQVQDLPEGQSYSIGGLRVTATGAQHPARRWFRAPWIPSIGYLLEAGDLRVYFPGDTDIYPEMGALAPLDVALMPVWGWGPTLGEGHLNPRSAAEALRLLRPRVAVPIHWGTFFPIGWGGAPLRDPPHEFAAHAAQVAPEVDVRVLAPGGELTI